MDIEKVYRIYFDDLYRFLLYLCKNKEIAQDICSESFIRAMKNIENISDSKVKSYLFQIGKIPITITIRKTIGFCLQKISKILT